MKSKFFLYAASLLIAASASAQKGVDNGTQFGSGEDSVRCVTNISLFIPYARSNNYKDAYPFWKQVYEECPASHRGIYQYGVDILNWLIQQEKDDAKRDAIVDELMKLYDDRAKYFGDLKGYGKDWIVSRKAQNYNLIKGEKTDPSIIYKWTGEIIDEYKAKAEPLAISLYMFASFKLMQGETEKYREQYIEDFLKCSALLDEAYNAAKAANNDKDAESLLARKTEIEQNFAGSGVADCETLQSVYASKIEENKGNLEFLKETMTLLRRTGCKDIEAYLAASEHVYKIEPTAESAMGLGSKAYNEKDFAAAEKYYIEAIGMTEDSEMKVILYHAISTIAYNQNQFAKAKLNSQKCLAENPNYGQAYITIAKAYAQGGKNLFPGDPVLSKCIYYAVVDKLEKARQVDPSVADEALRLIRVYREYCPSKEEVFMHPKLNAGENFTLPGWIGEIVKIR
ncbi:MAG: hypothetical protein LBT42_02045 [Tannerella sp.]|nr:hypothetical protein [Tannerella sp.]